MSGKIIIQRPGRFKDQIRAYKILVDRELRGTIRNDDKLVIPISAGKHQIKARIDWVGSNVLEVEVTEGKTTQVQVSNEVPFLFMSFVVIFKRNSYLTLKEM